MVAPPSVSDSDLIHTALMAAVPSPDLNLAVTLGQGIKVNSLQTANAYQSSSASGTATAPVAGTAIATLAIATAGYYKVLVSAGFGGTAESTALDNMQVKNGATVIGPVSVQNFANTISQPYEFWLNVTGAGNITVNAIAGASAGAAYKATIIATRVA
jgi:hypothetical protein